MKHFASIVCTIVTTAIFFVSSITPQAETFRPVVRGKRGAVAAGCLQRIAGDGFGLRRRVVVIALSPFLHPKFATLAVASGVRASD